MDKMNVLTKAVVYICSAILVITMSGLLMSACSKANTPNTNINPDTPAQNEVQNVTQNAQQNSQQGSAQSTPQNPQGEVISAEKAKEAVLSHAGISADAAMRYKSERDMDDGRPVYDIEFDAGGYEYDYEVDAKTGEIVKFDKEPK